MVAHDPRIAELYDALEDALAAGFPMKDGMVAAAHLESLMDTARALLMLHRGVEPIMPKRSAA